MTKKLIMATVMVALSPGLSRGIVVAQSEPKVTICHRTNSASNPYTRNTVDQSSVDGQGGNGDHFEEHKGPLASSEAVAQSLKDSKTDWGDIIPPVQGAHDGLNWTAEGQAMFNNDCKFATPPGGGGGGTVAGAQTQAAAGGVAAGAGGAAGSVAGTLAALGASIGTLGYGVLRLRKARS